MEFNIFFLTMYFGLPRYTPPRPLGETGVRRHWSAKYILSIHYYTVILHVHFTEKRFFCYISRHNKGPPPPLAWGRGSKHVKLLALFTVQLYIFVDFTMIAL